VHGGYRARKHESYWCSVAVAKYCDCRIWHRTGTGQVVFYGFPADVEVATYLMRVIEGSMNRSYDDYKTGQQYNTKRDRNEFMLAFSGRVNARLREMRKARHPETLVTTTGTSLVLVKQQVVEEQFAASGMKLNKGKTTRIALSGNQNARDAGQAAGNKVHLGGAVTGGAAHKRLAYSPQISLASGPVPGASYPCSLDRNQPHDHRPCVHGPERGTPESRLRGPAPAPAYACPAARPHPCPREADATDGVAAA
jgi:hypothetical protein